MKIKLGPIIGLGAVTAIWAVSALANYHAGLALSAEPTMAQILAGASVASDAIKAVALFLVIGALANKRYVAACLALVIFVLATGWSLRSASFFAASAIASAQVERQHSNEITDARFALLDAKQRRAEFLAQQAIEVDGGPKTRAISIEANKATANEFSAILAELSRDIKTLEEIKPALPRDPLAALLDVDDRRVAMATSILFALLLEIASATGFWVIARARPLPDPESVPSKIVSEPAAPVIAEAPQEPARIGYGEGPFGTPVETKSEAQEAPQEPAPALQPTNVTAITDWQQHSEKIRIEMALRQILEPAPVTERVAFPVIGEKLNEVLPKNKRLQHNYDVNRILVPALKIFPEYERRKSGGKYWAVGVRLRAKIESQRLEGVL